MAPAQEERRTAPSTAKTLPSSSAGIAVPQPSGSVSAPLRSVMLVTSVAPNRIITFGPSVKEVPIVHWD